MLVTQYWLWPSAGPLLAVYAIGIGALWLPWGWVAHRLLNGEVTAQTGAITAVAVLPSAWVIAEAVRSWDRLGGPWALLGASQWNQPATLAPASIGGVWLVSFLVVAVNTAVVGAILLRSLARGRTAPHPRGPRPCMVLVESGAAARADGSDRARPAR